MEPRHFKLSWRHMLYLIFITHLLYIVFILAITAHLWTTDRINKVVFCITLVFHVTCCLLSLKGSMDGSYIAAWMNSGVHAAIAILCIARFVNASISTKITKPQFIVNLSWIGVMILYGFISLYIGFALFRRRQLDETHEKRHMWMQFGLRQKELNMRKRTSDSDSDLPGDETAVELYLESISENVRRANMNKGPIFFHKDNAIMKKTRPVHRLIGEGDFAHPTRIERKLKGEGDPQELTVQFVPPENHTLYRTESFCLPTRDTLNEIPATSRNKI